ncbi:hypothetical protein GTN27_15695 [Ochrobactrum sp. EEELCW01]|nr:hypothetical protein GTN27_15695 [Ochrobactrum sp. EEELCW01]
MTLTPKQERFVAEYLIDADRFWSKVNISHADKCWNWQGAKDSLGYGRFHIGISRNAAMLAHRVAFGIATGDEPEAVCHHCDNPSCCNPSHLFGGTRADNNLDMARKGRCAEEKPSLEGENHPQSKLTNADVLEIRRIYADGGITQRQLAAQFGVCQRSINKAVRFIGFKNAQQSQVDA